MSQNVPVEVSGLSDEGKPLPSLWALEIILGYKACAESAFSPLSHLAGPVQTCLPPSLGHQ